MWTPDTFAELLRRHGCVYVELYHPPEDVRAKYGSKSDLTIDGSVDVEALVDELNGSEQIPVRD